MKYAEEIRKLELSKRLEELAKETQKIAEEIGFAVHINTGIFDDGRPYSPSIIFHPNKDECSIVYLEEEGEAYHGLIDALRTKAKTH